MLRRSAISLISSVQTSLTRTSRFLFSTSPSVRKNIDLSVDSATGVARMNMQKPPVNSLSLEMLTDMSISLDKLHAEGCRGMVLESSIPKLFSAGLDIMEMYQPEEARLREFWRTLQDVFFKLYGSSMVTMAAITGHAPAGGCILATWCDYRVMADSKITIGLNETLLGIVAPTWFSDVMINTVGTRETEKALQLGKLYSPTEALKIGLVDEVVAETDVLSTVNAAMSKWLRIPDHARHLTKLQMRQATMDKLEVNREDDINNFVKFIMQPGQQRNLGMYLESLKKKSK